MKQFDYIHIGSLFLSVPERDNTVGFHENTAPFAMVTGLFLAPPTLQGSVPH